MIGDELVEDVNLVDTNEEKEKALADGTTIIIDGRMLYSDCTVLLTQFVSCAEDEMEEEMDKNEIKDE